MLPNYEYSAVAIGKRLETTWVIRICLILLALANICSIISFTTTGWRAADWDSSADTGEPVVYWEGLWQVCRVHDSDLPSTCIYQDKIVGTGLSIREKYTPTNRSVPLWFRAYQAFAVVGEICILLATTICLVYMCLIKIHKRRGACIWTAIFAIFSGCGWVLSVVIFITQFNNDDVLSYSLGYSFFIACAAALFSIAAGVLALLEIRNTGEVMPNIM